ncbi:MAG: hypothetical protein J5604_07555 [Bacteroidales bacterium]|nr:hypothetical protein [Bacteroidales bacterium]
MKQTIKYLSIATLVTVGAMTMSCNKIDEGAEPQQEDNIVTLTTTVGFDKGATTRALSSTGEKTFAAGDQIAVIYKNTSNNTKKVVGDITSGAGTSSATFTVTLTNPKKDAAIRYIYPASMAKATVATDATIDDAGTVDFTNLENQNGTLVSLGSSLDLCTFDAATWGGENLPSGTMTNQLAILAITLKNGSSINDDITGMTFSDGTNNYNVTRSAADAPIYLAILPVDSKNISITATDGTNYYTKTLASKTYAMNNGYTVTWLMTEAGHALNGQFTINAGGDKVKFAQGNLQATYNGTSWSWAFAANQWDYIGDNPGNTSIINPGEVNANNVTVDLFGWVGESCNWTGAAMYGISNTTNAGGGAVDNYGNVAKEKLKSDWGNIIGIGWRTLTKTEWDYLFNTRTSGSTVNLKSDARYTYATINTDETSVNGIILFPDGVTIANGEATNWGTINAVSAWGTKCTSAQWTALAAKGCVFLPAAGVRAGNAVYESGTHARYMQKGIDDISLLDNYAYYVDFKSNELHFGTDYYRHYGGSVRLVRVVAP